MIQLIEPLEPIELIELFLGRGLPLRATKTPFRATSKNSVPEKYLYSSRAIIIQIVFLSLRKLF
jgi:hypothetical protein